MKNINSLILIGYFLFTFSSLAQDTVMIQLFTLKEAQNFALENNLNIRNAQLSVEQAEKVIWENTATGLPQLSSSFNYNNNLNLGIDTRRKRRGARYGPIPMIGPSRRLR